MDAPEINQQLVNAPQPCAHCDYFLPPRIDFNGSLYYPALPRGVCDHCADYLERWQGGASN